MTTPDSTDVGRGRYEPLVFSLPVPDEPICGLDLASPITIKIGYLRVQARNTRDPDLGVTWRVDLGLAKAAQDGGPRIVPCLVMRPLFEPLLDREALLEGWMRWQKQLVERHADEAPSEIFHNLPSLEAVWPSLAAGGRLRRAASLWEASSQSDEALLAFVQALPDRQDKGLVDDLVVLGAAAHVAINRAERARTAAERVARRTTLYRPIVTSSSNSEGPVQFQRAPGYAQALAERYGHGTLTYGDLASDAVQVVKAMRGPVRGAKPKTELMQLAHHVFEVLNEAIEAGEAVLLDELHPLLGRGGLEMLTQPRQFFAAAVAGAWELPEHLDPLPPEMERQRTAATIRTEVEREGSDVEILLNELPASITKMRSYYTKAKRRLAPFAQARSLAKSYRRSPGKERWRFLEPYLLGDNGVLIPRAMSDRIVTMDALDRNGTIRLNEDLRDLGLTAGVLLDALRQDSMMALLDTVAVGDWGQWTLSATPGSSLAELVAGCWRPLMVIRVEVEPTDPHYRRALGAVPEATPGLSVDTIVAGFVSGETAAWIEAHGWTSEAADVRLKAEARAIRDRQVAPNAGRVTLLTFDPRKPPAPERV